MKSSIFVLDPIKGVFWPFKVDRQILLPQTVCFLKLLIVWFVTILSISDKNFCQLLWWCSTTAFNNRHWHAPLIKLSSLSINVTRFVQDRSEQGNLEQYCKQSRQVFMNASKWVFQELCCIHDTLHVVTLPYVKKSKIYLGNP